MSEKLDYSVRIDLSPNGDNNSWSLSEFDEQENKVVKSGLQPWPWTLYFEVVDVRLTIGVEKQLNAGSDEIISAIEVISASLTPKKDGWRTTSYYMLGKKTPTTDITIRITKVNADETPQCRLWGGLAYESEWDFQTVRGPDALQFYLELSETHFNELKVALRSGNIAKSIFSVSAVSGFYSYDSPSIRTEYIKVLVSTKDQNVLRPDNSDIKPFVVGDVREFSLHLSTNEVLCTQRTSDDDEAEDFSNSHTTLTSDINSIFSDSLKQIEIVIKRSNDQLVKMLWIICGLLLLVWFF